MFVSLLFAAFSTKGLTLLRLLLMPTAPRKGQQTCRASADNLSGITHTGKVFVAASGSAQLNTSARYVAYHSTLQITLSTLFFKTFSTHNFTKIKFKIHSHFAPISLPSCARARAIYNLFYLLYYLLYYFYNYFIFLLLQKTKVFCLFVHYVHSYYYPSLRFGENPSLRYGFSRISCVRTRTARIRSHEG